MTRARALRTPRVISVACLSARCILRPQLRSRITKRDETNQLIAEIITLRSRDRVLRLDSRKENLPIIRILRAYGATKTIFLFRDVATSRSLETRETVICKEPRLHMSTVPPLLMCRD